MQTLLLIIVGIIGVGVGMGLGHKRAAERLDNFINKERPFLKEKRKRMLLKHLKSHRKLTNDEAQRLLGVSDTTVVTYFDELEKEGSVTQVGDLGRGVYYELA